MGAFAARIAFFLSGQVKRAVAELAVLDLANRLALVDLFACSRIGDAAVTIDLINVAGLVVVG